MTVVGVDLSLTRTVSDAIFLPDAPDYNEARHWLIIEPTDLRPLTINKLNNMHRMTWAAHTKQVRGRWHLLAVESGVPSLTKARFTVLPLHRDMRTPQDTGACEPEFKAALDGMVDAGVLPDDTGDHVQMVSFLPPLRGCGHNGMAVLIEEVA